MKKLVVKSMVALAMVSVIGAYAFGAPRVIGGILDQTTTQVVQLKADELSTQKLSEDKQTDPKAELRSYFDANITQEEYDFFVEVGLRTTLQNWENDPYYDGVQINEAGTHATYPNGTTELIYLSFPNEESEIELDETLSDVESLLEEQYLYDELRPKTKLKCEAGNDDELYYNPETGLMVFPKTREITQEDLLQYIDFEQRFSYVSSKYSGYRDAQERAVARTDIVSQAEMIKSADALIKSLYGESIEGQSTEFGYNSLLQDEELLIANESAYTISLLVEPYRRQTKRLSGDVFATYMLQYEAYSGEITYCGRSVTNKKESGNKLSLTTIEAATDFKSIQLVQNTANKISDAEIVSIQLRYDQVDELWSSGYYFVELDDDNFIEVEIDFEQHEVPSVRFYDSQTISRAIGNSKLMDCDITSFLEE